MGNRKNNINLVETLIDEKMIHLRQKASDWKSAVKLSIGYLVDAGKVTWEYYNAILRSVEENGPYFVIMPGVALPHARPENGVIASGFSLITLKKAINFGSPENDPIRVLLSFASTDAVEQLEVCLAQAVVVFEDEKRAQSIARAKKMRTLIDILRNVDFSELDDDA